ncbi:MAG: hypothetical protein ACSHXK_08560 [Oceanococcus sp.]
MMRPLIGATAIMLTSASALAADGQVLNFNHINASYIDSESGSLSGDGYGLDLSFAVMDFVHLNLDYNTRDYGNLDVEFISAGIGGNFPLNEAGNVQLFGGLSYERAEYSGSINTGGGTGGGGTGGDGGDGGDGAGAAPCEPSGSPLDLVLTTVNDLVFALLGQDLCEQSPFGAESKAGVSSKALVSFSGDTDGFGAHIGVRALLADHYLLSTRYRMREYDDTDESIISLSAAYVFTNWGLGLSYATYDETDIEEFLVNVSYNF